MVVIARKNPWENYRSNLEPLTNTAVRFVTEIVGMLESDGCDEGLNFCEGTKELDGLIVADVGQSSVDTFTDGACDGSEDKDGDVDG